MQRGALVNSRMLVAQVELILRLYDEALPGLLCASLDCLSDAAGREYLDEVYAAIPTSDFSRAVLARSVSHLSAVQVPVRAERPWDTAAASDIRDSHAGRSPRWDCLRKGTGSVDLWPGSTAQQVLRPQV
jgi:hypothetical protein